ncbi:MAG TPA: hypothetical protein VJ464_03325 [Blastocatellia bacterium]|nr:hypothetical protein [Blastocatellia bacterium]
MEQVQQMKNDFRRQVLRTKPVSQKLGELINLVNLLPPNIKTPQEIFATFLEQGTYDPQDWINGYKKIIAPLPIEVQDFIGSIRIDTLQEFDLRYSLLIEAKIILRQIARGEIGKKLSLPVTQALATLGTDKEGKIVVKPTPLADALVGVESSRIRECTICENIYWAGRIDQPCCSRKCNGIRRVRKWREQYPEKYKQQRVQKDNKREALGSPKAKNRRK